MITTSTDRNACQACGRVHSATYYMIVIKNLTIVLCPFCFSSLSNDCKKQDSMSDGF